MSNNLMLLMVCFELLVVTSLRQPFVHAGRTTYVENVNRGAMQSVRSQREAMALSLFSECIYMLGTWLHLRDGIFSLLSKRSHFTVTTSSLIGVRVQYPNFPPIKWVPPAVVEGRTLRRQTTEAP